jgi:hypothetical protein
VDKSQVNRHKVNLLLSKFFYSPTDAQVNFLKNSFKIYIEIDIKQLLHVLAKSPSSVSALFELARAPKHVGAVLMSILM